MTLSQNYKYASYLALAAGLGISSMLVIMLLYPNSNPHHFEQIITVKEYSQQMLANQWPLRAIMAFDNMYMIFLAALFIFAINAVRNEKNSIIVYAALIPVFVTYLLDVFENQHTTTLLFQLTKDIPISQADINLQSTATLMKFHAGQLGYFLIAFFLHHDTKLEKVIRFILLFVLIPFSVMQYPFSDFNPSNLGTYFSIAIALYLISYAFYQRSKRKQA